MFQTNSLKNVEGVGFLVKDTWAKWGFEVYGHFSDVLEFFGDKMTNLGLIDSKLGLYIKVNVNKGQNI